MKLKYVPFSQKADLVVVNSAVRSTITAAALAFALANSTHIPTTEVEDPYSHFNLQLLPGITPIISDWNESMIFDVHECVELIRSLWLVRYTAAYPTSRPIYSFNLGFFETMFGVSTYVSPETKSFLDANKEAVLSLAICASEIILIQE